MIESPVLQKWFRERDVSTLQELVLEKLAARFGPLPADVSAEVRVVADTPRLKALLDAVYASASLDEFRTHLTAPPAN